MSTHHRSTIAAAVPERRRADLVSEGFIADYVALRWLEWNGGALRLTVTGNDMCEQMRAGLN